MGRPAWYSKKLCLHSLVIARRELPDSVLTVVSDGPLPVDVRDLIEADVRVVVLPNVGNAESFLAAYSIAAAWPVDDVAYFVEDDYLHMASALSKLQDAFTDLSSDYVTLYDHPNRYNSQAGSGADLKLHTTGIYASRSHIWRTVESTCMTFAARIGCLRDDMGVFLAHVLSGRTPRDRAIFRHLQGLGPYEDTSCRRVLLGAIPGLATHCNAARLAPTIDWESIAAEVERAPQ
jgi:hypothetical protein